MKWHMHGERLLYYVCSVERPLCGFLYFYAVRTFCHMSHSASSEYRNLSVFTEVV